MILLRMLRFQLFNLINIESVCRLKIKFFERSYSVFPKYYEKPIVRKEYLQDNEKIKELKYLSFKPAFVYESSSEFYDPVVSKFINYLTKKGKKINARCLVEMVFQNIKIIQLQHYNSASPEEQDQIELDPKVILRKAIENCSPVLELINVKQGSQNYKVPTPVVPNRSRLLAVKWLLTVAKQKKREDFLANRIAEEILNAFNNTGRVIKIKQDLYKQCQANKSYVHYRW